jgi:hypothetical protein
VWNSSTSFSCFALSIFLALIAPGRLLLRSHTGMASALAYDMALVSVSAAPVLSSMMLVSSARLLWLPSELQLKR